MFECQVGEEGHGGILSFASAAEIFTSVDFDTLVGGRLGSHDLNLFCSWRK